MMMEIGMAVVVSEGFGVIMGCLGVPTRRISLLLLSNRRELSVIQALVS
jgi:hypothetical protein